MRALFISDLVMGALGEISRSLTCCSLESSAIFINVGLNMEAEVTACTTSYINDFGDFLLSMYDKSPTITSVVVCGAIIYAFYSRWLRYLERKIIPLSVEDFRAEVETGKQMRQGNVMNTEATGASDE
ncbi:hypothetical protein ACW5WQ_21165 [Aeromonas rivuli]|uniref:hypothetical protein n=1 Tax=Aeromonas rivuli TaxID=648794 RepID=UPI0012ED7907|nr:hypothetical protein [Aeromonas rivuli]